MNFDTAISNQFDLPGVGAVSVASSGVNDPGQEQLANDIAAITPLSGIESVLAAMAYAAQSRAGLTRITTQRAYAVWDGAQWVVDMPWAGVWFTCDYTFTYASATLNTYDVVDGVTTDFVSANASIPSFWKRFVLTLEDGAGATAASGSWTP